VRIFKSEATPPSAPVEQFAVTMIPITATPAQTAQPLIPLLTRVIGETSLEDAAQRADISILLPTHPSDIGQPDHVFVQDADGEIVILVWLDPQIPDRVRMSLHIISSGSWAIRKFAPQVIEETTVNGQNAVWTTGPYPLIMQGNNIDLIRLVEGHVLIWADGDVTYRLETNVSLDEAVMIAESLQPLP
jgi:hypothetical protein